MSNKNITIRKATPKDAVGLALLGRITFAETFSAAFADQQGLQQHCQSTYSVAAIRKALQQKNTTYLMALYNELPVGYIKLIKEAAANESSETSAVQMQKIYVLKDFIACGIGSLLHDDLLSEVNAIGATCIWLMVWEKNSRAIKFYSKHGYEIKAEQWDTVGNETFLFCRMEMNLIRENEKEIAVL